LYDLNFRSKFQAIGSISVKFKRNFIQKEEIMPLGIIEKFQKEREELNQRRAMQAWDELKSNGYQK
jgi:hypothetical protein